MNQTIDICEIFTSIQGESSFAGLPCVFIRTSGCSLRCAWCDTEYAFSNGTSMTIESILEKIRNESIRLVEVTGGEPLDQPSVLVLIDNLVADNYRVLLETSGAVGISQVNPNTCIIMDIKCPGSGMHKKMLWDNIDHLKKIDEVKFVLSDENDYEYARGIIEKYSLSQKCSVLLSVVSGAIEPKTIVARMLADKLDARFQIQMHKIIWPDTKRGV